MLSKIHIQISCSCPLKLLSGTRAHLLPRWEEEGGLGLLGEVRRGTESLMWLPEGITNALRASNLIAWCLNQSLFLEGSWQMSDFFWLSFLNILILNLSLFDAVVSSSCMHKARRRRPYSVWSFVFHCYRRKSAWKCDIQGTQTQLSDALLFLLCL